jgi:Polysaccharide lyase
MGTPWGKNRWMAFVPQTQEEWFACNATSPPNVAWANGGGSFEVSSPHGPGFRLRATPDMQPRHCVTQGSPCKRVDIADYSSAAAGHPGPIGTTDDYSGWLMFPSGQDPFPRNHCCWNVLFEFKATGQPGGARSGEYVPVGIGIDTTDVPFRNHIYLSQNYPSTHFRRALAPAAIVHDHWYQWRLRIHWSGSADGIVQFWIDGAQVANWPGATIGPNDTDHRTQMTFYGPRVGTNEVVFAGLHLGL